MNYKLTPEQLEKFRNANFNDHIFTKEELFRAGCTHKDMNGTSALMQNSDGTWTCTICHEIFRM